MKKITLILVVTLIINLIGHNFHRFYTPLFYYCEYLNYLIGYASIMVWFWKRNQIIVTWSGIGVIFCLNDIIDLAIDPYISHANEWIFCLIGSYLWHSFVKMKFDTHK